MAGLTARLKLLKIMNITEKYKNSFINEYFERAGVSLKSYVMNSDSFHFFRYGEEFKICNEKELFDFLDNHISYTKDGKKDNLLHYFEFGEFPAEKAVKPVPNALSFEEQFTQNLLETLQKKGKDYNGGAADSLALFKKVGSDLNEIYLNPNIPEQVKVILTNRAIKTERIKSLLLSGGVPNFESLQDSILDDCCYGVLLAKAVVENANANANEKANDL